MFEENEIKKCSCCFEKKFVYVMLEYDFGKYVCDECYEMNEKNDRLI